MQDLFNCQMYINNLHIRLQLFFCKAEAILKNKFRNLIKFKIIYCFRSKLRKILFIQTFTSSLGDFLKKILKSQEFIANDICNEELLSISPASVSTFERTQKQISWMTWFFQEEVIHP